MDDVSRETRAREREAAYADLLRTAELNLVSRRDLDALEGRHLPESRAFAHGLPIDGGIVDVGSGGGLPGLVCAIWEPMRAVALVESRRRKAAWLVRAASILELDNVTVHHQRAEEVTASADNAVVTARAVAPLPRLLGFVAPLMAAGSTLHAIKGARWAEELAACGNLAASGWELVATPTSPPLDGYRSGPVDAGDPHPLVVILRRRG